MSTQKKIVLSTVGLSMVLSMITLMLTGCSVLASNDQADAALATCSDQPVAAFVAADESGSSSSESIRAARLAIIEDAAHRAALCEGGWFKVVVFSSSSGATVTLYDNEVTVAGATDQAKSRRVDSVLEQIMTTIRSKYTAAVAQLPSDGSDITSVLRLSSEFAAQHPGYQLDAYLLTDGLSNVSVNLEQPLTSQQAIDLADSVAVPDLPSAWLTVAGIGHVDDHSTSSAQSEALVAFYTALCQRTNAASCTVVTDFSKRW